MAHQLGRVGRWALALGSAAHVYGTNGNFSLGPFSKENKWVLESLTWLQILRLAVQQRFRTALALALALVRVSPGAGLPKLTLFQFVTRRMLFGPAGLRLPPVVPADLLFMHGLQNGQHKRHLMEKAMSAAQGPAWTLIRPLSATDFSLAVPFVFVSEASLVEQVMGDKVTYPTRGHTGFTELTGDGLLGLPTGKKWHKHRKVVSSFLTEKHMRGYGDAVVAKHINVLLDKWADCAADAPDGSHVANCYYDMSAFATDVIMNIGTGDDTFSTFQATPQADNELAPLLDHALKVVSMRTAMPLLQYFPDPVLATALKRNTELFDAVVEHVKQRRVEESGGGESGGGSGSGAPTSPRSFSLMDALLTTTNDDGTLALTEKEARDEFATVRGAGSETTSNSICFMLMLLSEHPECFAKLRSEVDATVSGRVATYDEAKQLSYGFQVMLETLRLFPTVPSMPRNAACDTDLGAYRIPKGSFVFVSQWALNREGWPEPERFMPERFDATRKELHPTKPVGRPDGEDYAFIPFGAGARTCIGQRLAMNEGVQVVASVIKNFDFAVVGPRPAVFCDITLGPKHGMALRLTPRK